MNTTYYSVPSDVLSIPCDTHVIVEASAGTGKTFWIEHRFIHLLINENTSVDQILVVTFTKKAAAEIKHRIRNLIEKILTQSEKTPSDSCWTITPSIQRCLQQALEDFDNAAIHTIHGFCQRILSNHAFDNGYLFDQQISSNNVLLQCVFLDCIKHHITIDPELHPWLDIWLKSNRPLFPSKNSSHFATNNMFDLLFKHLNVDEHTIINPLDINAIKDTLHQIRYLDSLTTIDKQSVVDSTFYKDLIETRTKSVTCKTIAKHCHTLSRSLSAFQKTNDLPLFIYQLETKQTKDALKYLKPKKGICHQLDTLVELLTQLTLNRFIITLFLPVLKNAFEKTKQQQGFFDYQDLLTLTEQSLRENEAFKESIRNNYGFVFVDEFQDTDQIQWSIFKQLFVDSHDNHVLSIVGDPKQSIYRFRNADIYTYMHACHELEKKGAQHCVLKTNHRATSLLVQSLNQFFAPNNDNDKPFEFGEKITYAPAIASDNTSTCSPIRTLSLDNKKSAIMAVAQDIQERLKHSSHEVNITSESIFVLAKTNKEVATIAEVFNEHSIRCVVHSSSSDNNIFKTPEANDVLDLLIGIQYHTNKTAFQRAQSGPFFAIPINASDHKTKATLLTWHLLAKEQNYPVLFHQILYESGVLEREIFFSNNHRSKTNYVHCMDLLFEIISKQSLPFESLIDHLRCLIEQHVIDFGNRDSVDTMNNSLALKIESTHASVQVMTIHASKGLEADIVYLCGGLATSRNNHQGPYLWHETLNDDFHSFVSIDTIGSTKHKLYEQEIDAEDRRLVYVALTRAKKQLVLPSFQEDKSSWYQAINQRIKLFSNSSNSSVTPSQKTSLQLPLEQWNPTVVNNPWSHETLQQYVHQHRESRNTTSYSQMKAEQKADVPPSLIVKPTDDTITTTSFSPPRGAVSGNFLHYIFEKIPHQIKPESFEQWHTHPYINDLFEHSAIIHSIASKHLIASKHIVYNSITSHLPNKPITQKSNSSVASSYLSPLCTQSKQYREIEFLSKSSQEKQSKYIKGYIDLVFQQDNKTYLLDWKSDVLDDYQQTTMQQCVNQHYHTQMFIYLMAMTQFLSVSTEKEYEESCGGMFYAFVRGTKAHSTEGDGFILFRPSWDILNKEIYLLRQ